jgi:uncharacterized protein YndB with AHSA1/START domain
MIEFVVTIVINKPLAEVFRFVAHLENIPQWVRGAHVVILSEGPFGDGTLFQQDHEVVRVDHVHVNHGFETESIHIHFPTRLVLKHTHGILQFEPARHGTQFSMRHQFELTPLLKPFEPLLARRAHQESQAALEHLKTLLEQKSQ